MANTARQAGGSGRSVRGAAPGTVRGIRRAWPARTQVKTRTPARQAARKPPPSSRSREPSSGPRNAPACPAAENRARTWARGAPAPCSCRTASRAASDSTAGENSAAAKPMRRTAAMTVAVEPARASHPNPAIRRAQPASTTGRGPYRSVSAPPTTKRPC
ncbi:hypothetical protein A3L22_22220 [Streptomyces griseus subsp. griseus]|nr:hypothetical protein A3L22_22220 [Streptomyces griseus subsp. griseus]